MNIKMTKKVNIIVTVCILVICLIICIATGITFKKFSLYDPYFYEGNATEIKKLYEYSPSLKGTVGGETDIYIIKGPNAVGKDPKDCPSILILGGTHPNEPSGQLTAVTFLENLKVNDDTIVYILTETNKSAFTHSHPQEASAFYYQLKTKSGAYRTFKFGSRATNTNQQWPNPDVYVTESGQKLSTNDTRNLNRSYPGKENGTYTERVAYGITQLIIQNDIKVTIDLHEASPEYITINAMVYHDDASKIASYAKVNMDFEDVEIGVDISPKNLRGLTHRELGDATDTFAILCETSNASQGKIRGAFTSDLITYYSKDKFYEKAKELTEISKKDKNAGVEILYGYPVTIDERVARHTLTILSIIAGYNNEVIDASGFDNLEDKTRAAKLKAIGSIDVNLDLFSILDVDHQLNYHQNQVYNMLCELGVGYFLHDPE